MPLYDYRCDGCGRAEEVFARVADWNAPRQCPGCGGKMQRTLPANQAVRASYKKPLVSDAMGFVADAKDVAEHRKRFPQVDLVIEDGCARPKFTSLGQKRAYLKAVGWADTRDYR